MKGRKDHQAAAQEAFEEAGVSGRVHKHPMGAYTYMKTDGDGEVDVRVYLLEVETEHADWPERSQRRREWMPSAEAAGRVEAGLVEIVRRLDIIPRDV